MISKRTQIQVGGKYGKFTVVEKIGIKNENGGGNYYLVKCECGKTREVRGALLTNGTYQSCGCAKAEKVREWCTKAPGVASFNYIFRQYRLAAKKRNLVFDISRDEFEKLAKQDCFWCGQEPSPFNPYIKKDGTPRTTVNHPETLKNSWIKVNGLDRINNEVGYITENIVPCCEACNRAKLDHRKEDFVARCRRVAERHK